MSGAVAKTTTVTVTTVAQGVLPPFTTGWPLRVRHQWMPFIVALLGMFLLSAMGVALSLWRREPRFRRARVFAAALLLCAVMALVSCGGGSSSGGTNPQAGTYTVTVTGNFTSGSANLTHATKLTLLVQ